MITLRRVVLLCVLVSVALTASLLAPIVFPSVAEVDVHSVWMSLKAGSSSMMVNVTGQTVNLTVYQSGVPTETCTLVVTSTTPVNSTEGVNTVETVAFQIVNGSCAAVSP